MVWNYFGTFAQISYIGNFFHFYRLSLQATGVHTNHQFLATLEKVVELKIFRIFSTFFSFGMGARKLFNNSSLVWDDLIRIKEDIK